MHSELLQYADDLKKHDIQADIARTAMDLQQYMSQGDDLIFLGEGIFPNHSIEQKLHGQSDELIYVVSNADNYENFERIDLTHRWLGIAVLKTERFAEIAEIPDDWDIGSALLRTAVQAECKRELVSDPEMQADAVPQLLNLEETESFAKRQLGEIDFPKQNFFEKFVTWPLMRKLMPFLWKSPSSKSYSGFASLAAATVAVVLGVLGWPAPSLSLLFIASVTLVVHQRISIFSVQDQRAHLVDLCFRLLAAAVLTVAVVHHAKPESLAADITILLLLVGNLWLANTLSDNSRLKGIMPDTPLILLVLSAAATFGLFSTGLYLSALMCLAYLMIAQNARGTKESQDDPAK